MEQKSAGEGLGKYSFLRLLGIAGQNLIFFALALLIRKALDTEALGRYILVVTLVNVAGFASTLGLKFGVVRFVAWWRARGDLPACRAVILRSLALSALAGLVLGALLYGSAGFLAGEVFRDPTLAPILRSVSWVIPFAAVSSVLVSALQGLKKIGAKVLLENLVQPLGGLVLVGVALGLGAGAGGVMLAWALSIALGALAAALILRPVLPSRGGLPGAAAAWRPLLTYSTPLLLVGFLYYLLTRMDILMLARLRPAAEVGVYGLAARLAILIPLPLEALNVAFEPAVAEVGREDRAALSDLYRRTTPWIFSSGLWLFLVLLALSPFLLGLFGKDFSGGWEILVVLGLGQAVNLAVGSSGVLLSMTGHSRVEFYNTTGMVALNFLLNLALIPRWGGLGAAWATAAALAGLNLLRLLEVRLLLGIHPFSPRYGRALLLGAAALGAPWLLRRFGAPDGGPFSPVLPFAAAAALYPLLAWRFGLDGIRSSRLNTFLSRFSRGA